MYFGKIVELAKSEDIYHNPAHPYTKALLDAIPSIDGKGPRATIQGDIPNPADPPPGCSFSGRCPIKEKVCEESIPPLNEVAPGHLAACHLLSQ